MLKQKQGEPVDYPSSDGKPMAENDTNRACLMSSVMELDRWFHDRSDVYVSGDMLIFDTEGNNRRHLAPDVFVVLGVEKRQRENYKLWEEKPPSLIIEILSRTTLREDLGPKKERYAAWGVQELYFFDPRHLYIAPPLQAHRLENGVWVPLTGDSFFSPVLGLEIFYQEEQIRFRDPATGELLSNYDELAEELAHARQEIIEAARKRQELEAEIERLQYLRRARPASRGRRS